MRNVLAVKKNTPSNMIDSGMDGENLRETFVDKYKSLYNYVSYNKHYMHTFLL